MINAYNDSDIIQHEFNISNTKGIFMRKLSKYKIEINLMTQL